MVEFLSSYTARLPTPPRKSASGHAIDIEAAGTESPHFSQSLTDSPFSSNESSDVRSQQSKRVNFSPWTKYIKPPTFGDSPLKSDSELKVLRPSNECKPAKSILKTTHSDASFSPSDVEPYKPERFDMLLESVTQQLAGESPSSRLDAYMHLLGALRTYEGIPEQQEIEGKIDLITQFIQRDITRDLDRVGPLDTNIAIQALKLSIALLWHPAISESGLLSEDFRIFLIETAIDRLQGGKSPKSILMHYMHILSTQNFDPKIMTTVRLTRLLTMLHNITSRVSGNAAVYQRLSIYQRILDHSKSTFVGQTSLWMEHLISGLLHPIKDTRLKAITLGYQTAMIFGPHPLLSKSVREIFDKPLDNERKLVKEICERMSRMMASTDSGVHVPQVWSIIILLLRNKKMSIDQWEHFKEWVLVLQKCFNCSESAIKAQAILGWNRFVFVVSPNETTNLSILRMLGKPILSQFERKKLDKMGTLPSQLALSSYYNLLYYAFRPAASHQFLDVVWEEYVALPSTNVFSSLPHLCDRVSRALASLLWSPQAKAWSENRVIQNQKLEPDELPSLDCKWVRSRVEAMLKVFESLFKSAIWNDEAPEKSNIATAWFSLCKALSYAGCKEITPSAESMHAVAHLLRFLQGVWSNGLESLNVESEAVDKFLERFRFLSSTMILTIGSDPFTEKLLVRTAESTFQAANTPTHRHARTSSLDNAISHLLRIITTRTSTAFEQSPSYLRLIDDIIQAACNGRMSRGSRLDFLRQCADLDLDKADTVAKNRPPNQFIWRSTARLAANCLSSFPSESARERDGTVSCDYNAALEILSLAVGLTDIRDEWNELLDTYIHVVRTERGDCAIATLVIEPLAVRLLHVPARDAYHFSAALLKNSLSIPFTQRHGHSDGTSLPAIDANVPKTAIPLFPHDFIRLTCKIMLESYDKFIISETSGMAEVLESLTSFLESDALTFQSIVLEDLQQALSVWLKDEKHQLNAERGVDSRVLTAYHALSSAVLNTIQTALSHDFKTLQKFETVLVSGFESSHMSIMKRSVDTWKSMFGSQKSLKCPQTVKHALHKLGPILKRHKLSLSSSIDTQNCAQSLRDHDEQSMQRRMSPSSLENLSAKQSRDSSLSPGLNSSAVFKGKEAGPVTDSLQWDSAPAVSYSPKQVKQRTIINKNSSPIVLSSRNSPRHVSSSPERRPGSNGMFTLIGDHQSCSSRTRMPRDLDLHTPPKLRNLHVVERATGPPSTPNLTRTTIENNDIFIGSSPTPATRSCLAVVEVPSVNEHDLNAKIDPPSSPPELEAAPKTPENVFKASALSRQTNAVSRNDFVEDVPVSNHRDIANDMKNSGDDNHQHQSWCEDVVGPCPAVNEQQPAPPQTSSWSAHANSNSMSPKTDAEKSLQPADQSSKMDNAGEGAKEKLDRISIDLSPGSEPPTATRLENPAEFSSDDVEIQIASQIEQDMVLAGDYEGPSPANPAKCAASPHSSPGARKRKREITDVPARREKEKRRCRRSAAQRGSFVEAVSDPGTTRSRRRVPVPNLVSEKKESLSSVVFEGGKSQARNEGAGRAGFIISLEQQQSQAKEPRWRLVSNEPASQKGRKSRRRHGKASSAAGEERQIQKSTLACQACLRGAVDVDVKEIEARPVVKEPQNKVLRRQEMQEEPDMLAQEAMDVQILATTNSIEPGSAAFIVENAGEVNIGSSAQQTAGLLPGNDNQMPDAEESVEGMERFERMDLESAIPTSQAVQTEDGAETANEGNVMEESLLQSLKEVLKNLKKSTLSRNALRDMDDVLFEIRVETHEANRRHADSMSKECA